MTTITTNGIEIIVVPVREYATDFKQAGARTLEWRNPHSSHKEVFDFKVKLLGVCSKDTIDFDWSGLVEKKILRSFDSHGLTVHNEVWRDYSESEFVKFYYSDKDSFRSLLSANGIHFSNPYGERFDEDDYDNDIDLPIPICFDEREEIKELNIRKSKLKQRFDESQSKVVSKVLIIQKL